MSKFYLWKTVYTLYYLIFLISERGAKHAQKSEIAEGFVKFNNKRVLRKILKKPPLKVSILLPHCIQNYNCSLKITSKVENCKECGLCNISEFVKLKKQYENLDVKVATGGTLARRYLKEQHPDLVIAVACKRDLVSGIYDGFPMLVYGVFNEIENSPCIDTKVSIEKIKEILKEVNLK